MCCVTLPTHLFDVNFLWLLKHHTPFQYICLKNIQMKQSIAKFMTCAQEANQHNVSEVRGKSAAAATKHFLIITVKGRFNICLTLLFLLLLLHTKEVLIGKHCL